MRKNGTTTYSLPNIHGDIFATVNADGALTSTFMTGPFGEVLPTQPAQPSGATAPTHTPTNTTPGTTYSYVGQHQKLTDTETSGILGGITQMGARVYIAGLGRFLQIDPVEGGTDNNYAYANDPVNEFDLSGEFIPVLFIVANVVRIAAPIVIRAAVSFVAKQVVPFVARKAIPYLTKKAIPQVAKWATNAASKGGSVAYRSRMIIKGYTRHGLNQAISRNNHGVSVRAIYNAVHRPVRVIKQPGHKVRYNGRDAVVILNKQKQIITTWAKNRNGWRY